MLNESLAKIYRRVDTIFNNVDLDTFVKHYVELNNKVEEGDNQCHPLLRLIKEEDNNKNFNKREIFVFSVVETNSKTVNFKEIYPGDLVVGFYFPLDEFRVGEKIEYKFAYPPIADYFKIKNEKKVFKPIGKTFYYEYYNVPGGQYEISNPLEKKIYIIGIHLNNQVRRELHKYGTYYKLYNGLCFFSYSHFNYYTFNDIERFSKGFIDGESSIMELTYPYFYGDSNDNNSKQLVIETVKDFSNTFSEDLYVEI